MRCGPPNGVNRSASGCRDLNPGPLDPQSSALTKLRHSPSPGQSPTVVGGSWPKKSFANALWSRGFQVTRREPTQPRPTPRSRPSLPRPTVGPWTTTPRRSACSRNDASGSSRTRMGRATPSTARSRPNGGAGSRTTQAGGTPWRHATGTGPTWSPPGGSEDQFLSAPGCPGTSEPGITCVGTPPNRGLLGASGTRSSMLGAHRSTGVKANFRRFSPPKGGLREGTDRSARPDA